jgi:hypothetical protein
MHGWAAGPILLEFVAKLLPPLSKCAMTAESLSKEASVETEALTTALRTCTTLGYVSFNATSSEYSIVPGSSLDELAAVLAPDTDLAEALHSVYTRALPPFRFPSYKASLCLQVWAQHRDAWQKLRNQNLPALLDGSVLAPLVTSLSHCARYDEQGMDVAGGADFAEFDLGALNIGAKAVIKEIIEDSLQIGKMDDQGVVLMTSEGSDFLKDWCSHYAAASSEPRAGASPNGNAPSPGLLLPRSGAGNRGNCS